MKYRPSKPATLAAARGLSRSLEKSIEGLCLDIGEEINAAVRQKTMSGVI